MPETPEQLADHNCLIDSNLRSGERWPVAGYEGGMITVSGNMQVNSATAVHQMVIASHGLGLLPGFIVGSDIENGCLRQVLSEYTPHKVGVYAVYSHRRHLSAKVRLFIDFMSEYFSEIVG